MDSKQHILFYDFDATGHHFEYILYLIKEVQKYKNTASFSFLLNDEFALKLSKIYTDNISIIYFDVTPFRKKKSLIKRTRKELTHLNQVVNQYKVTDVFFLALDPYQIAIGLNKTARKINYHGILFSPYPRIQTPENTGFIANLKQKLRKKRKELQLNFCVKNQNQGKAFVLNDETTVQTLNRDFSKKKQPFRYLPDPILQTKGEMTKDLREIYNIDKDLTILLAFGSIIKRKNLERCIKAVNSITGTQKYCLLIAGKGNKEYTDSLLKLHSSFKNTSNASLIIKNEFLSDKEIPDFFTAADVVLMPYINFYGSSGVLGHAMRFGKPVIAAEVGLIADLVRRYELGITINPLSQQAIARAILKSNDFQIGDTFSQFYKSHSPQNFAKTIIETVLN